ncbi:TPA: hypothetical protein N0F65_007773, partial [Lagenidium giganteum]
RIHQTQYLAGRILEVARPAPRTASNDGDNSDDVRRMSLLHVETQRIALVVLVLVSDLFFTGLVFGWAPLLLMLKEERQYLELCDDPAATRCLAQENRLNLMFALASVAANAGALPVGVLLDWCGPKVAIGIAAVVEISGLVLLALADSQTFDVFVPAYVLLALGGCITMMASYPASFLIMQHQTAILAAISCLFDGSSVNFLALYAIHITFNASRMQLFLAYTALAVLVYSSLFVLWHWNEPALRNPTPTTDSEETTLLLHKNIAKNSPVNDKDAKKLVKEYYLQYGSLGEQEFTAQRTADEVRELYRSGVAEAQLTEFPVKQQVMTFEFAYILIFAASQVLRTTVYIGTTNKLLENYGDADRQYLYTKVFSVVLPLGFVFVPAIDYVVERRGLTLSLIFTNAIGVLYNVLVLVPVLPLQALTFLVFTGFRAFLYAVMSAFTAKTFGLKNLGTLVGMIFSISSVVGLLEYPAVYISNQWYGGDLSVIYWISLFVCIALFPLTECHRQRERERERQHKALLRRFGSTLKSPPTTASQGLSYRRSPCMTSPNIKFSANHYP